MNSDRPGPGCFATLGPGSCRNANFFEVNASGPEGLGLVRLGFAIDATNIISMAADSCSLQCGPLLLIALIATMAVRVR